jgi:hypothetical protein
MELVQPNDSDHCLQKLRRATHAVGSWKERALRGRAVGEKMTLQLLLILQHKFSNEGRRLKGHLGVNSADEAPRWFHDMKGHQKKERGRSSEELILESDYI